MSRVYAILLAIPDWRGSTASATLAATLTATVSFPWCVGCVDVDVDVGCAAWRVNQSDALSYLSSKSATNATRRMLIQINMQLRFNVLMRCACKCTHTPVQAGDALQSGRKRERESGMQHVTREQGRAINRPDQSWLVLLYCPAPPIYQASTAYIILCTAYRVFYCTIQEILERRLYF